LRRRLAARLARRYVALHGNPALLHAHGTPAVEFAYWWHRRTGVPYIVTLHAKSFYEPGADRLVGRLMPALAAAALRLAVSPGFAARLSRLSGLPFRTLANPVDTDVFAPRSTPRPAEAPFTFASIGALDRNKNHRLLVDAFARGFGGDAGYRLAIGGSGPEGPALARQAARLGIAGQVDLPGQIDREGVQALLQGSDAFVLPSRIDTFGVVLVEAMACGLPVIATRSDGPAAVIRDSRVGLLCEHEVDSLAAAMSRVAQGQFDPTAIRAEAVGRFGLAALAGQLAELYDEVAMGMRQ
jgi:glycosyltransferase involved in cell wall biosynthesis